LERPLSSISTIVERYLGQKNPTSDSVLHQPHDGSILFGILHAHKSGPNRPVAYGVAKTVRYRVAGCLHTVIVRRAILSQVGPLHSKSVCPQSGPAGLNAAPLIALRAGPPRPLVRDRIQIRPSSPRLRGAIFSKHWWNILRCHYAPCQFSEARHIARGKHAHHRFQTLGSLGVKGLGDGPAGLG
jgi:hypothetical protein